MLSADALSNNQIYIEIHGKSIRVDVARQITGLVN